MKERNPFEDARARIARQKRKQAQRAWAAIHPMLEAVKAKSRNCSHQSRVERTDQPSEARGAAIDGGRAIQCANTFCGQTLEVLA